MLEHMRAYLPVAPATGTDSSLVFGGYGAGLATDLDEELTWLYHRLVERYAEVEEPPSRDDDEVWQVYTEELDRVAVTPYLSSNVTITAPRYNYTYVFSRAWKNERWHPLQPASFDLVHGRSILEKANTWIGRSIALEDSGDIGKLHMLVGSPRQQELIGAYRRAIQHLRDQLVLGHEVIEENEAAAFSERLADMVKGHGS